MAKCIASSSLGAKPDTYLYKLAQAQTALATIGSDDVLRLFDPTLKTLFKASSCHEGVSCLDVLLPNTFATAGRDSLIRLWDSRARKVAELSEPNGKPLSAIACHGERYIAAGTDSAKEGLGDVSVLLFDVRNPAVPLRNYAESHTDAITQLAFHPTQANVLLSGSIDGLISLFDIDQADEEDALQQVLNPRSAVHCAGFLAQDQAYILTTDEQFLIHSLIDNAEGADTKGVIDFGDVREQLKCMYVIDLLRDPTTGLPVLACGHNEQRTLSLVQLAGPAPWTFGQSIDLATAHGDEVVRDVLLVADRRAYSCGEDGQVKAWQL